MSRKTHKLKIRERFLEDIEENGKSAEVRDNTDRDFREGDFIEFYVNDGDLHTKCSKLYEIKHIMHQDQFIEGLNEGYCMLSIVEVKG